MSTKIPVIIDTDIGSDIDDTWALAMALGCPELDVRMIVTCTGDTHHRAAIVCKLLEAAGRTDIPVGVGIPSDVGPKNQAGWVGDYSLDDYPGEVHLDGVAAMGEAIESSEETISLVCIGPLPNISALLASQPGVVDQVRFVGMHGSVYRGYHGTDEVHPEYNVFQHLPDAQKVLSSAFPITITPLDTCGIIRLEDERFQRVARAASSGTLKALIDNYEVWLEAIGRKRDTPVGKSSVLFDTVAIYLAFADDLLEMEGIRITVEDKGFTRPSDGGKLMNVAVRWRDQDAFLDLLVERLLAAP